MTTLSQTEQKERNKKIKEVLEKKYHGFTPEKMFSKFEYLSLTKHIQDLASKDIDQAVKMAEKHFEKLGILHWEKANIDRQNREIKSHELNPAYTDVKAKALQMGSHDVNLTGFAKEAYYSQRDEVPTYLSSFFGGTESARRAVREQAKPIFHQTQIPSTYRNLVMDAQAEVLADIAIAQEEANLSLQTGTERALTDDQKKAIKKQTGASTSNKARIATNMAESSLYAGAKLINKTFSGIIGHTNPAETPEFQKYKLREKERLSQVWSAFTDGGKRGSAALKAWEQYFQQIVQQEGVLGEAEFADILKNIREAIVAEDKAEQAKLDKFCDDLNKLNKEMLDDLRGITKKEDDAFKYKIAQVALLMCPLGLFNYMIPLTQILGPMLSSTLSFGEGLGKVAANVPLVGGLVEKIHLDVAISSTIDNLPGVSQFTGAANALTDSEAAQNLFGVVAPATTGVLPMLAIAAGFNLVQTAKHVENAQAKSDKEKAWEKKQNALFDLLRDNPADDEQKKRMKQFATKHMQLNINRTLLNCLGEFITHCTEEEMEIFKNCPIGKDLLALKKKPKDPNISDETYSANLSKEILAKILSVDGAMRKQLLDAMMVYQKIGGQDVEEISGLDDAQLKAKIEQDLVEFRKYTPQSIAKIGEEETNLRRADMIIDVCEGHGMTSIFCDENAKDPAVRLKKAADYEMQYVENKIKSLNNSKDIPIAIEGAAKGKQNATGSVRQPIEVNLLGEFNIQQTQSGLGG